MKRQLMFGTIFSAALAVGAAAQSATQPPTGQEPSAPKDKTVTVTGCLQSARDSVGTSGTTGSATAIDTKFVLMNASSGGAASAAASATGTSGSSSAMPAQKGYNLVGGDKDELTKSVDHKVEINGTLEVAMSTAPSASSAGSATSSRTQDLPTLRVTSIRDTGDTCAAGGQ
jgi:hypothetical protein